MTGTVNSHEDINLFRIRFRFAQHFFNAREYDCIYHSKCRHLYTITQDARVNAQLEAIVPYQSRPLCARLPCSYPAVLLLHLPRKGLPPNMHGTHNQTNTNKQRRTDAWRPVRVLASRAAFKHTFEEIQAFWCELLCVRHDLHQFCNNSFAHIAKIRE